MRRLALLAAALAVACSSKNDGGGPPPSDTTPPAPPTIAFPDSGATLAAIDLEAGHVVFSGAAEPGATVRVEVDGTEVGQDVATAAGSWAVAAAVPSALGDGAHAVRARAVDAAGNDSGPCAAVAFTLDATAPLAPAIDAPEPLATSVAGLDVIGRAEANATVRVRLDGAAVAEASADAAGAFVVPIALPGSDGAVSLTAVAVDAAGNVSPPSGAVAITIDRTPPAAPTVSAPEEGALVATASVRVAGTAEPNGMVRVTPDAGQAIETPTGTLGAWEVTLTLADGARTITVRAIDAAGNFAETSRAFTVDTTRVATSLPAGAPAPVTSWGQTVGVSVGDPSGLGEQFPYQANSWVVDRDFALVAGNGLEYSHALVLFVGTPTGPLSHGVLLDDVIAGAYDQFPGDQDASEVTFLTPVFRALDGVVTAAVSDGATMTTMYRPPLAGALSGYLNGTSDARLSQPLTFDPARTYTFSWTHRVELHAGRLVGAAAPSYQVVLRDPATGAVVGAPLFSSTSDVAAEPRSVTRSGLPSQAVLSFELRSAEPGYAELDDVAVTLAGSGDLVTNGDFELGMQGWQANGGAESQNVRSGTRDVGAPGSPLRVSRTFYAPPASPWGRLVDVFENTGTTDVTTTAIYLTMLGAPLLGGSAASAVTVDGKGLVGWDAGASVRDVGLVFGTGSAWISDTESPDFVFVTHELTVPAGGKVALLHFVVQLGEAAGGLGSATAGECASVVAGYPALEPYRQDFEAGVRALVANF